MANKEQIRWLNENLSSHEEIQELIDNLDGIRLLPPETQQRVAHAAANILQDIAAKPDEWRSEQEQIIHPYDGVQGKSECANDMDRIFADALKP